MWFESKNHEQQVLIEWPAAACCKVYGTRVADIVGSIVDTTTDIAALVVAYSSRCFVMWQAQGEKRAIKYLQVWVELCGT